MRDLAQLIERVEKLTGPDREVDAEIMFDIFATPVGKHKEDGGPIGYIRLDDQPSWNLGLRFPGKDRDWFQATRKQIRGETLLIERDGAYVLMNSMRVPEISASLDAAIALTERLLPGWTWNIGGCPPDFLTDKDKPFGAELMGPVSWAVIDREVGEEPVYDTANAQHSSPALALVIATLRALAAREGAL